MVAEGSPRPSPSTDSANQQMYVDNRILPVARVGEISVLLDGKEIPLADDYSDVLNPDREKYLVLVGAKGIQILVSIPSFSTHTITITAALPAPVEPILWILIGGIAVAVVVIAEVLLYCQIIA